MNKSNIIIFIKLIWNILRNRGLKHFLNELIDLIFIDIRFNLSTFIRKNNKSLNYVPYYWRIFTNNIIKLKNIINFKNTYFVDLGSGKGRILFASLDLGFIKIIGIEKNRSLFRLCKKNIKDNNLSEKIQLINQDFHKLNFRFKAKTNIIFFWYGSSKRSDLRKILIKYKKKFNKNKIFFYIIPDADIPKNIKHIKLLFKNNDFKKDITRNSKIITFV